MGKKGLVLILVLGILAVLIIAAAAFARLTSSETQMVRHQVNSIRAFYLAEAGIEEAIYRLKKGDSADFKDRLYSAQDEYDVDISGASPSYTITSTGGYPSLSAADKKRKLSVEVMVIPAGNPSGVTNAIELNGTLTTSGAVTINGTVEENSNVDFQGVFGITKEQVEALATNKYTDPANNTIPVSQITWVNLIDNSTFTISSDTWSGSGILVVKKSAGSAGDVLQITGGSFHGIIWIMGNLRVSGNANISGAVFVENGSAEVSKLTGTPTISYNSSDVENAFGYLGNSIGNISHWQEVL